MEQLKDKVVLVTGGARGLGEAICQVLARSGARVVVADIRRDQAQRVSSQIRDTGYIATPMELDVADESRSAEAIRKMVSEMGRVDVLINNAGVDVTIPIEEMSVQDWDRIIDVNLRGPFLLSKYVLPHMRQRKSGHILNVVSTAAKRTWPNASAYHASKWGLLGFTHALHTEARPHNVKVTALICGGMRTPFLLDRFPDIDLNNLQDPVNVAETVRFILSTPEGTVIPEVMALPMRETSWP
jgi:NAD(P)-dependent dehydrogenase (short-subunit alcohol dehydrogenase family)